MNEPVLHQAMTSNSHSTLLLDQIRQALLPQRASLDLMAKHAEILERLNLNEPKPILLNDLCIYLDAVLGDWQTMILGDLGNGSAAVGEATCEKESVTPLGNALRGLPDLKTVYPVGKLSVESSLWQQSCPERTVSHFGCLPVGDSALLVFTSNQSSRLDPSLQTVAELIAQCAQFVLETDERPQERRAPQQQAAPISPLAAAKKFGDEIAILIDKDGMVIEANEAAERLLMQPASGLIGQPASHLGLGPESTKALSRLLEAPSTAQEALAFRLPLLGSSLWVRARSHSLPGENGETQTVILAQDISKERELLAQVTSREAQLKAATQSDALTLFQVDRRGVIVSIEGGFLSQQDRDPSAIEGRNAWSFCHDNALRRKLWRQLRRDGQARGLLDSEFGPLKITLAATLGPNGKPQIVHGVAVHSPTPVVAEPLAAASPEVTQSPAEASSNAKVAQELCPAWLSSLQASQDAVVMTDAKGLIRFMNQGAEQLFNCRMTEASGQPFQQVGSFGDLDPIEAFLQRDSAQVAVHQVSMTRHDGTVFQLSVAGAAVNPQDDQAAGVILCCRNEQPLAKDDSAALETNKVSFEDRQRLEQENFRALSMFAGGIAHDLNNILTSLVGNVSLANMLVTDVPEASERLVEAERACFRAKDLSHQLLTFAKGSTPVKKVTRLEDLIQQCADTYLRGSKSVPRVITKQGLWSTNIDEGQISQVFETLIQNADHSMPHGGMITISAENIHHKPSPENAHLPLEEGVYVKVSISDEGPGIPEDQIEYIFRPYHTSNESGRGLGLATTFTIMKNHGGHIVASSDFGQGTMFTFYLPATGKTKQAAEDPAPLQPGETVPSLENGRILVIDDEKSIRDLATTTLKLMGCDVVTCPSSSEGVERFIRANQEGQPFDLVIMDLTIPGDLGGNEAMQQILSISPKALGVASSGYSEGSIMAHYREYGFQAALSKPYNIGDLQRVVSNMLIS